MSRFPTHKQVYFETMFGDIVEVDKGMFDILEELKRLGVKTQFSCQGSQPYGAYVLADRYSFGRLLRKIYIRRKLGFYSVEAKETVDRFLAGHRMHEFAIFADQGCDERYKVTLRKSEKRDEQYSIEHSYSTFYGLRTSVRWPRRYSGAMLRLLRET